MKELTDSIGTKASGVFYLTKTGGIQNEISQHNKRRHVKWRWT